MLEVQGNSVIFYAFYTEDGVGDTGLTVTVTVYEVIRDGTKTEIVSDAAVTEIGDGLYRYLLAGASVDAAAEYVAVFHTADTDTDQKDMPAMWVIDRANLEDIDDILLDTGTTIPGSMALEATLTAMKGAGWTDETLVAIKTALDAIDTSGVATAVWAAATRTLTQSAASVAAVVAGSDITATRGDTLSVSLTNIGALTNYSKIWFTVKQDAADADIASIIQIELTDGLKYINGAVATTAANGSITVDDEATGDITIALAAVETAKLSVGHYYYDIQILRSAGTPVSTLTSGSFDVSEDYTRATS